MEFQCNPYCFKQEGNRLLLMPCNMLAPEERKNTVSVNVVPDQNMERRAMSQGATQEKNKAPRARMSCRAISPNYLQCSPDGGASVNHCYVDANNIVSCYSEPWSAPEPPKPAPPVFTRPPPPPPPIMMQAPPPPQIMQFLPPPPPIQIMVQAPPPPRQIMVQTQPPPRQIMVQAPPPPRPKQMNCPIYEMVPERIV